MTNKLIRKIAKEYGFEPDGLIKDVREFEMNQSQKMDEESLRYFLEQTVYDAKIDELADESMDSDDGEIHAVPKKGYTPTVDIQGSLPGLVNTISHILYTISTAAGLDLYMICDTVTECAVRYDEMFEGGQDPSASGFVIPMDSNSADSHSVGKKTQTQKTADQTIPDNVDSSLWD